MKKRFSAFFILFLCFSLMFGGCAHDASFVLNSYRTLAVGQQSYDSTMTTFSSLSNKLDAQTKADVMRIAGVYYKAHNSAVAALVNYELSKSDGDKIIYERQLILASSAMAEISHLLNSYLSRGGEE